MTTTTTTTETASTQENKSCIICTEKYNITTRHPVPCEYCTFTACHKCTSTYLLSQPVSRCMDNNCNREWTRKHMTKHLSPTFRSREFKQHTEQILFDKESAYFQETQREIEEDKRREEVRLEIYKLEKKRHEEIMRIRDECEEKVKVLRLEMGQKSKERVQFVQRCIYDNCQGFMSSQWKCGLCDRHACNKCHKPKKSHNDPEHECNPDDIASVDLIQRETKPCPKCHTQIYKIHGCDQMWCTNCKTPFSWIHGTIITGPLHNPHYHEYLAQMGREDNQQPHRNQDNGCREMPDVFPSEIRHVIECVLIDQVYRPRRSILLDLCRIFQHIVYGELRYYEIPTNELAINTSERKAFLKHNMVEDEFKKIILKNYKEVQKTTELRQIMEMIRDALRDIYFRLEDYVSRKKDAVRTRYTSGSLQQKQEWIDALLGFTKEIDGVRDYANSCVRDINIAYQSASKKLFSRTFQFIVGNEDR